MTDILYEDSGEPSEISVPLCGKCNTELEWVECNICFGEGVFSDEIDDYINEDCHNCNSRGGWYECPACNNWTD